MEQKHINVIRTCLKCMRAFGNEKSKSDIEETLKALDKSVKHNCFRVKRSKLLQCPSCKKRVVEYKDNYCSNCSQKILS